MDNKYSKLRLENQLCFPLYAASKEIIRQYTPFLDPLDLTYTQYITMMVIWEEKEISVKSLGQKLFLDSGTLTPVLKALEKKGFILRKRSKLDERKLLLSLTEEGIALKEKALLVPDKMGECLHLTAEESTCLYQILYKILGREVQ